GNHGQRINPDLQHLAHRCLPAVTISNKWQRIPKRAQRSPELNVHASDIVEVANSSCADIFENSCHQITFVTEERLSIRWFSNRVNRPVPSNKRAMRPCSPCKQNVVFRFRAIFSASSKVAIPEVSIYETSVRSTVTVFGGCPCNMTRSRSRRSGDE